MVVSNKQRKKQNRHKAAQKAKAAKHKIKKKAKKKIKPTQPDLPLLPEPGPIDIDIPIAEPTEPPTEPINKLLPAGVKSDDTMPISDMDLPSRAIAALEDNGLTTKGDIRQYVEEHGSIAEIKGIGRAWASLIETLSQ